MAAPERPSAADLRRTLGDVFGGLDDATLEAIAAAMERVDLEAGSVLVRQGELADRLYLVLDGELTIVIGPGGSATGQGLGVLGPGDVVGEVAVLTGTRRTATVESRTAARLAALRTEDFRRLAIDHPELVAALLASSVRRLRRGQLAAYLSRLFGPLDPALVDRLEPRIEWVSLRGGDVLFQPGDPGDALYLVLAGRLRVIGAADGSRLGAVEEIGRGQPIGMTSVLTGRPRLATVVAVRDTELARISRDTLRWFTEAYPRAAIPIMAELADRLERAATAPLQADDRAATFGLIASAGVDGETFGRLLADELSVHGRTLVLTSADATAAGLGTTIMEALPAGAGDAPGQLPLHHWLEEREAAHDFVVYVADAGETRWSDQCLRQADQVIVVADATGDPAPTGAERLLEGRWTASAAPRRTLLLVQPPEIDEPRDTARWLAPRLVDGHLHLRRGVAEDLARVGRLLAGRGVTLVLGGGGARGYAHLGVVRAMEEIGIPIDMVGGTSMGALVASGVARRWDANRQQSIAQRISGRLFDPTLPIVSILAGRRIWRAIEEAHGGMGVEDLWLPFFCVSSDITVAAPVIHRTGPLARAVRASASLPGILPPVSVKGHLLVDGGLLDTLPIGVMRRLNGGSRIIAVDVSPRVDVVARGEVGDHLSGWRLLRDRIRHPRSRPRIPGIVELLSRTVAVPGLYLERERARPTADLLVQPSVERFATLDFGSVQPIAAAGYDASLDLLQAWWRAETRPPAAEPIEVPTGEPSPIR